MRFDSNRGRGSIQIGLNLLLSEGYSEVSEVLVLSLLSSEVLLGFSEVESEVLILSLLNSEVLLGFSELESKVLVLGLLSIQLLLGFSEVESEVLVLSLLSSEVESEVSSSIFLVSAWDLKA